MGIDGNGGEWWTWRTWKFRRSCWSWCFAWVGLDIYVYVNGSYYYIKGPDGLPRGIMELMALVGQQVHQVVMELMENQEKTVESYE